MDPIFGIGYFIGKVIVNYFEEKEQDRIAEEQKILLLEYLEKHENEIIQNASIENCKQTLAGNNKNSVEIQIEAANNLLWDDKNDLRCFGLLTIGAIFENPQAPEKMKNAIFGQVIMFTLMGRLGGDKKRPYTDYEEKEDCIDNAKFCLMAHNVLRELIRNKKHMNKDMVNLYAKLGLSYMADVVNNRKSTFSFIWDNNLLTLSLIAQSEMCDDTLLNEIYEAIKISIILEKTHADIGEQLLYLFSSPDSCIWEDLLFQSATRVFVAGEKDYSQCTENLERLEELAKESDFKLSEQDRELFAGFVERDKATLEKNCKEKIEKIIYILDNSRLKKKHSELFDDLRFIGQNSEKYREEAKRLLELPCFAEKKRMLLKESLKRSNS